MPGDPNWQFVSRSCRVVRVRLMDAAAWIVSFPLNRFRPLSLHAFVRSAETTLGFGATGEVFFFGGAGRTGGISHSVTSSNFPRKHTAIEPSSRISTRTVPPRIPGWMQFRAILHILPSLRMV